MPVFRMVTTIKSPVLGGTGTNTWHARVGAVPAPDSGDLGELKPLSEMIRTFYQSIVGIFPYQTVLAHDGEWVGVGPDEGTYAGHSGWQIVRESGGPSLPPANAICVNWRGQSGDRSRRGRTFLGPITDAGHEADGTIGSGTLSDIRGAAAALVESSDTIANGALGVWSRQEGVLRDFVASSVRDQFAVLRSRRD